MRYLDKQVTLEFQRIPEIDLTSSREFDMKFDFSRLLKSFLFLTLSSVVLGLYMRDLQKTPGEWPVLLLSLVLSVGILWVVLSVLWTLTQGLKQILLGTVQVIDSPRVTALLGIAYGIGVGTQAARDRVSGPQLCRGWLRVSLASAAATVWDKDSGFGVALDPSPASNSQARAGSLRLRAQTGQCFCDSNPGPPP